MSNAAPVINARLETRSFMSSHTGSEIAYKALVQDADRTNGPLPLILHLHGAMSSADSLEASRGIYEAAWASGTLPPAIVACATTPTMGGFYMDYADGPKWETMLSEEFPEILESIYGPIRLTSVVGASMGGYGALKLAFRRPERFLAVAALCPVVFPGETAASVPLKNLPSILSNLNEAMGPDPEAYRRNSIYGLARDNAAALREGRTQIYFDCGDRDEFGLHDGAMYLDQVLHGLNIPHQFRSVAAAGHAGEALNERMEAAAAFLGDVLHHVQYADSAARRAAR